MKKRITAFALCLALLTMMVMPAGLAEDPTPAPVVEPPAPAAQTEKPTEPVKVETVEAPVVKEAPANEPANEPVNEPADDPANGPANEPANEPEADPTKEPEAVDPTQEPEADPTQEPSADPTQEPSADPTVEPTVEPTAEPTVEPTVEPAVEPIALQLSKSATYGVADQKSIAAQAVISGGVAPYAVRACVLLDGDIVYEDNAALSEAGTLDVSYLPHKFGKHDIRVTVIDAQGNKAEKTVTIPVAVIEEETERDWRKSVSGVKLGSDWRENIIEIAKSQLGYHESDRNFVIDDDGKVQGYTRYGHWYGSRYEDWCAMFVAFVLNYADITEYTVPRSGNCENWKNRLNGLGAYEKRDDYVPQTGDLIFFDWKDSKTNKRDGVADHIGIVSSVSGDTVYTIEGNSGRAVSRQEYALDSKDILGYGNLAVLMERAGLETVEAAETEIEPVNAWTAGDRVNLRSRASVGGNIVTVLETEGTEIVLLAKAEREDGEIWYKATDGENTGYVRSDLVKFAQPEQPAGDEPEQSADEQPAQTLQGATNTENVNVRAIPSTKGDVVAKLEAAGTQLTILAEETGADGKTWFKVEVDGKTGYIRSDLVQPAAAQSIAMLAATDLTGTGTGTADTPDTTVEYDPALGGVVNVKSLLLYPAASLESGSYIEIDNAKGAALSVKSKFTDADGAEWYFVEINGATGYVPAGKIKLVEFFVPALEATVINEFTLFDANDRMHSANPGTEVSVEYKYLDSAGDKWYGIKLVENDKTYTGETLATDVKLIKGEPLYVEAQNDENGLKLVCTESNENASYRWQKRVIDEAGNESWIEVAEGALLKIEADKEALLAWYRCVRTLDDVETASAAIRPVNDEWVEWLENNEVTTEMIRRALGAKSLEAVVIEDGQLVYARAGEVLATYDAERNLLIDAKWQVPIASVDPETGVITPLTLEEMLDLMSGSPQEPEADEADVQQ